MKKERQEKGTGSISGALMDLEAERRSAQACDCSLLEAQLGALREGRIPLRFDRTMGTLGREGQAKLLQSTVAVAGCGGLGGLIIDLLARSGIGRLHVADGDIFSVSNLNRQILSTEERIGRGKAATAADHVRSINRALDVQAFDSFIDEETIDAFLEGVDVVVDGLDNNTSRRLLLKGCRQRSIPFVHGAIAGFWGQIQVIRGREKALFEDEESNRGIERQTGNPPFTPALVASLEVAETIKLLTGRPTLPEGTLLWIDLENLEFRQLEIGKGATAP